MSPLPPDRLKQYACELGFDLCGIAAAGPAQTHARYVEWLAHGYHAGMDYLARPDAIARRADLRAWWPAAQSVIVVAMNYYAPPPVHLPAGRTGRVARYAWGPDYHRVMTDKLEQLAAWIEAEFPGNPTARICVDTGAVLEREWAVRAGLGWIGKNAMLIHPRLGSWLVLGELVVDLALAPDAPFVSDRCGTCTRCLQACPTQCILPDRTLDARRCLSYLTIESRDEIPVELRKKMGNWVFGCDVCQEVCPWNRRARPSLNVRGNPDWVALDPAEITAMDEATFRARFAGSALRRARRSGLIRNVMALVV